MSELENKIDYTLACIKGCICKLEELVQEYSKSSECSSEHYRIHLITL